MTRCPICQARPSFAQPGSTCGRSRCQEAAVARSAAQAARKGTRKRERLEARFQELVAAATG